MERRRSGNAAIGGCTYFMNQAQRRRQKSGFEAMRNPKYSPRKYKTRNEGRTLGDTDTYGTTYTRDASGAIRRGLKAPKVPRLQQPVP